MALIAFLIVAFMGIVWYFAVILAIRCDRIIECCDRMIQRIEDIQKDLKDLKEAEETWQE